MHKLPFFSGSGLRPVLALLAACGLLAVSGCSGGSDGDGDAAGKPTDLLAAARTSLERANTIHFTLTSADVPENGTRLMAGEGVVARPKSFQGKLSILLGGNKVSIDLISADARVYAKLPFSKSFQVTDPATFGLSDPANLIDSKTGIARMFGELTGVSSKGEQRIGDDVVTQLNGSLPGTLVEDLLTSADPATPVKTELYITKADQQLRRVVLTGPFFEKGKNSTFNLLLDKYGAPVTITAPPTS
jgi:lipoprotein LprG